MGNCSKSSLARKLGVSRGSLYYKPKQPAKDEELRVLIERVMFLNPGYGHVRVGIALEISKNRALRVMKKYGLKPARRCKSPTKPDDQGRAEAEFANLMNFCPIEQNYVWVSDFTFISFQNRFIYLATVKDLYTQEILGFSVRTRHTTELVMEAFEDALVNAGKAPDIFHTDQGSEYNSDRFISRLCGLDIRISMSPKASPWRNGSQESFFGRFKTEFGDFDRFNTLAELIEEISQYIYYYNNDRIHTRLRMSPTQFVKKLNLKTNTCFTIPC